MSGSAAFGEGKNQQPPAPLLPGPVGGALGAGLIFGCRTLHGSCEGCGFSSVRNAPNAKTGTDRNRPAGKGESRIRKTAPLKATRMRHPEGQYRPKARPPVPIPKRQGCPRTARSKPAPFARSAKDAAPEIQTRLKGCATRLYWYELRLKAHASPKRRAVIDGPIFNHHLGTANVADVFQRIGAENHEVCPFAGL